jgi:hypothetical protein
LLDDLRYTEHESANQANIPTEIDGWPSLFLVWGGFFLPLVQLINLAIKKEKKKKTSKFPPVGNRENVRECTRDGVEPVGDLHTADGPQFVYSVWGLF